MGTRESEPGEATTPQATDAQTACQADSVRPQGAAEGASKGVGLYPGGTLWFQVVPGVEHWIRVSVISINRGRIVVRPLRRTDVPWAEAEIPDFTRFRTRRPDPRDALRARLNGEHATRAAFPDRSDDMLPIDGGGAVVWPLVIAVVLGIVAGLCGLIGFGATSTVLALVAIAAVGVYVGRGGPGE